MRSINSSKTINLQSNSVIVMLRDMHTCRNVFERMCIYSHLNLGKPNQLFIKVTRLVDMV